MTHEKLRVALVAGTLGKGGAEKQLVFMVGALKKANVDVQVYCATRGEFYESDLVELGCTPIWYGQRGNPVSRVVRLAMLLRKFRPHVVQSAHFYTNLYVALASRAIHTLAFGGLRNDAVHEVDSNGRWGPWLIRLPPSLIANSELARTNAAEYGVKRDRVHVLSNVIDLNDFDQRSRQSPSDVRKSECPTVITVCRLVSAKRLDRLLEAIRLANERTRIKAMIVGDGPDRPELEKRAKELDLDSEKVRFLGWRDDIPSLLRQSDLLVISSDHEGFPNVLLEAMAAGIPAVSTPAGDAPQVIQDNVTGFIVPFDDVAAMADRIVQFAGDSELRTKMGAAARSRVETTYSPETLADRMMQIYRDALPAQGRSSIEPLLST
jgi:glycosyltransferase involved in cell wall biosynthesis